MLRGARATIGGMQWPFELALGWRYTRSSGATGNRFLSFIAGASMLGIALGVAALIIVLSVMNGFQKEVRDRMLGVVAHVEVLDTGAGALRDIPSLMQKLRTQPDVVAQAPFVASQALLARGEDIKGVMLRGVDPQAEGGVIDLGTNAAALARLQPGQFGVVLGAELARGLNVREGDAVTLLVPSGQATPAGVLPRVKTLRVVGLFESGHYEYDAALALLHLDDAARIFRLEGASGMRLRLRDLHAAPQVAATLAHDLGPGYVVRDWTRQNRSWFAAVQVEKRMMFIILTLIVAVAAFNLVSTLVMTVTDKRGDIAILRTLGASPGSIMALFVVQGALVGVVGTLAGLVLGLAVACNIDVLVPTLERALHTSFLPRDIYLISHMPSDPQGADIVPVVLVSLLLALLATLYPSWRAARVQPAQALRYE